MASNKTATIILFDVGASTSHIHGSESFFKKSQWCLLRIIQRKIFSDENDEVGIVLFGCEETENELVVNAGDDSYCNIHEYSYLHKPDWNVYEKVNNLKPTDVTNSNWLEGLIVSLNYLKEQSKGKKFKDKQIIIFSNFSKEIECDNHIKHLSTSIDLDNIKLLVIGIDLVEECKDKVLDSQLSGSIGPMFSLLGQIENGVSLSFDEAEENIIYYEKKKKMGRFTKVNLTIGSEINIPIRWIKLNLEPTRVKWERKQLRSEKKNISNEDLTIPQVKSVMETQKQTKFGESKVLLNYADLEAMKRKTGPPSCILLGCVKRQRIHRKMFVGQDIYLVVPEKSSRPQAMLSAFIDALIDADKYAIVRRVAVRNGKIKIGVLVPVSDEVGKVMYFLQLPFAEYELFVPEILLPEANDCEVLATIDSLIDTMTIPDQPKNLPLKDPIFQLRCHVLHSVRTGEINIEKKNITIPDYIKKLFNPYPELLENAMDHIKKLESLLPTNFDEQLLLDQPEERKVSLKGAENMFQEEDGTKKIYLNKPDKNDKEESMDWAEAETQEWHQELKEKYGCSSKETALPNISLNEDFLATNKYEKNYVSDKLWMKHGNQKKTEDTLSEVDLKQMLDERQNTDIDYDTNDMLQRIKAKLETHK